MISHGVSRPHPQFLSTGRRNQQNLGKSGMAAEWCVRRQLKGQGACKINHLPQTGAGPGFCALVGERVWGDSGQAPLDGFGVAKSTVTGGSASALKTTNTRQLVLCEVESWMPDQWARSWLVPWPNVPTGVKSTTGGVQGLNQAKGAREGGKRGRAACPAHSGLRIHWPAQMLVSRAYAVGARCGRPFSSPKIRSIPSMSAHCKMASEPETWLSRCDAQLPTQSVGGNRLFCYVSNAWLS